MGKQDIVTLDKLEAQVVRDALASYEPLNDDEAGAKRYLEHRIKRFLAHPNTMRTEA